MHTASIMHKPVNDIGPEGGNFPLQQICSSMCCKGGGCSSVSQAAWWYYPDSAGLVQEMPVYKWWSPGVWLQNQSGRAAAAATEVSAMIVITGVHCSFYPIWSCRPAIQTTLVTYTYGPLRKFSDLCTFCTLSVLDTFLIDKIVILPRNPH